MAIADDKVCKHFHM